MNPIHTLRAEILVNYFLAFDAVEVRMSFLTGKRDQYLHASGKNYKNRVLPLIINMFSNHDISKERTDAFIYIVDIMTDYAQLLVDMNAQSSEKVLRDTKAVKNNKASVSSDFSAIRMYLNTLLECDGTAHYFSYGDLTFEKEIFEIWPKDLPARLSLLGRVHDDYEFFLRQDKKFRAENTTIVKNVQRTPIATARQLMAGAKQFMSHTGVAACFSLLKEGAYERVLKAMRAERVFDQETLSTPAVFRKLAQSNIASADRHLDELIIDFMKCSILLQLGVKSLQDGLTWEIAKRIVRARHAEQRGLGQGFAYRYRYYWRLLREVTRYCGNDPEKLRTIAYEPSNNITPRLSRNGAIAYTTL